MIHYLVHLHAALLVLTDSRSTTAATRPHGHVGQVPTSRWRNESGQATTEYALVLLAAALVALLVVAWATAGGGAAKIGQLFDGVIDSVIDKI